MRRYTIVEIDKMREAVLRKNSAMTPQNFGVGPTGLEPWAQQAFDRWRQVSEEELRTYLLAGIAPEELI